MNTVAFMLRSLILLHDLTHERLLTIGTEWLEGNN